MLMKIVKLAWGLIVLAAAVSVIWFVWVHEGMMPHEAEAAAPDAQPADHEEPRVGHNDVGESVIHLDAETIARVGLKVEALQGVTWTPEAPAYGVLLEDPALSFTVRAPAAGVLHAADGQVWPQLGQTLADGANLGFVEPRWVPTPLELADRAAKLNEARASVEELTTAVEISSAAYERLKTLNDQQKNVSDKVLQEALGKMKGDEARLRAAQQTVKLYEGPVNAALPPMALDLRRGGEVVELLAHPGESVEPGQPILRVARFDRLLARVNLLVGQQFDRTATQARIVVLGHEDEPLVGERVSMNQTVNPMTLGQTLLLAVTPTDFSLAAGEAVTALLPTKGEARPCVMIPRSAIVRYLGKTWVYVQSDAEHFTRREVTLLQSSPQGWFSPQPLKVGDKVVTVAAQTLLSTDLSAQYQVSEEE